MACELDRGGEGGLQRDFGVRFAEAIVSAEAWSGVQSGIKTFISRCSIERF